ncbi:MAG: LysM peptidoglycan-binding domain-containing protein [Bdellovibrionales bacterium]|nr:LysM peptidoglycan-binding domain-containing protein [Bdellovibrionales bacterium]
MRLKSFVTFAAFLLQGLNLAAAKEAERLPLVLAPSATYQVHESGENLSLIALRLYGKSSRWKEIATLNEMKAPYRLKMRQILRLPTAPTLTQAQGNQKVLAYWRRHFGLSGNETRREVASIPKKTIDTPSIRENREPKPEIDDAFVESGKELLVDRKLEKAFDYFSPLTHLALDKFPKDDELVYLDGASAERIFGTLKSTQRKPASTPGQLAKIAPNQLRFSDYESKSGTDIVCAKVPLVDVNRQYVFSRAGMMVFNYRCVGLKK